MSFSFLFSLRKTKYSQSQHDWEEYILLFHFYFFSKIAGHTINQMRAHNECVTHHKKRAVRDKSNLRLFACGETVKRIIV